MSAKSRLLFVILIIICLVVPAGLVSASDISDAQYYGKIQSTNTGAAASSVAVPFTLSTQNLIDGSMLEAGVTDCAIRAADGSDVAFMPGYGVNPWVYYISSMAQNEQQYHHLYTGGATPMGGKMAYFPGDAGLTINDAAALELGQNYKLELKGYYPTQASSISEHFGKTNAIWLYSIGGVLGASINPGFVASTYQIWGDNQASQTFTPKTDFQLSTLYIPLLKVGTPTGNKTISIKQTDGDGCPTGAALATYTLDAATLATSLTWHALSPSDSVTLSGGSTYAIVLDPGNAGTSPNNRIGWGHCSNGGYAGGSKWISADAGTTWSTAAGDYAFTVGDQAGGFGALDLCTPLGPGDYLVELTSTETRTSLCVDGIERDSAPFAISVANNSYNYAVGAIGAMPYMEYLKITINGTLQQHLVYQYAETPVIDISGQDNQPASVSVRTTSSDADVSAALLSFGPAAVAATPAMAASDTWKLMDEVPDSPGGLYSELDMDFLFADQIVDFAASTSLPLVLLVYVYALGAALLSGLIAFRLSMGRKDKNQAGWNRGSILAQALVSLLVMVYFTIAGDGVIPAWLLLPFALEALAALMIKQTPYPW